MILVIGRRFRLLRWDRAGIIATSPIDYIDNPSDFRDCLWRLSLLDDTALGFDPSATRVLPEDVDYLRMDLAAMQNPHDIDHTERPLHAHEADDSIVFEYTRTLFRSSLSQHWPRHKLWVVDDGTTRSFLVGRPLFRAGGTTGRGTRGYVALDCQTRRFVWLKDAWRAAYVIAEREGDVLRLLNRAGVENVPTLVCHGDVCDQTTVTTEWWERKYMSSVPSSCMPPAPTSRSSSGNLSGPSSGGKRKRTDAIVNNTAPSRGRGECGPDPITRSDGPLRQHKHYRIVVEEVGLPLRDFRNGRQLASIVLDAMIGEGSRDACRSSHHPDLSLCSSPPSGYKTRESASSLRHQWRKYPHIPESQARQQRSESCDCLDRSPCRLGAVAARGPQSGPTSEASGTHGGCSF